MATHSSILAWRILWTEEPGGRSPWGCKKLDRTKQLLGILNFKILWAVIGTNSKWHVEAPHGSGGSMWKF